MFHLIYHHAQEAEGGGVRFVAELMEKGGRTKQKDTGKAEKRTSQSNEGLEGDTNSNREAQKTLKRDRNVEKAEGMYKHPQSYGRLVAEGLPR